MPFLQKKNPLKQISRGFQPRKKPERQYNSCKVCLESIHFKQTYSYVPKGCSCKLHLHDTCFTKWNRINPGFCPSCKNRSTIILEQNLDQNLDQTIVKKRVPTVNNVDDTDVCCVSCIGGTWCILGIMSLFSS